jgi:hypothetical protein
MLNTVSVFARTIDRTEREDAAGSLVPRSASRRRASASVSPARAVATAARLLRHAPANERPRLADGRKIRRVPDDEMFGEHKQGLFARLTRSVTLRRGNELKATVRKTERLSLTVPSEKAEAVRAAVERWLGEHGVTAEVTAEDAGEGKTKIRARLGEADAPKIDFSSEETQSALQDLLADAVK